MSDKFASPDVDNETEEVVLRILRDESPAKPWNILDAAVSEGINRGEARKVLRKLRLRNRLVPAGDFTGAVRYVESKK